MGDYEIRNVRDHVEVYCDGVWMFSADTQSEARSEIREQEGAAND